MIEIEAVSKLFDERLSPLRDDIKELKNASKKVVDMLLIQVRQDEKLKRVDEHLQECVNWRKATEIKIDEKFSELTEKELEEDKKKENYLWEIIKVLLYILAGGTVGSAISKLLLH